MLDVAFQYLAKRLAGKNAAPAGGAWPTGPPQEKLAPLGSVARVFPNVSLAMCPLKLFPLHAGLWRQYWKNVSEVIYFVSGET